MMRSGRPAISARWATQASRFHTSRPSWKISKTPSLKISRRAPAGTEHDREGKSAPGSTPMIKPAEGRRSGFGLPRISKTEGGWPPPAHVRVWLARGETPYPNGEYVLALCFPLRKEVHF